MTGRVAYLDGLRSHGIWPEFYDPDGQRYGLPTYPWRFAPDGLLTLRQLRAKGLRPGGQAVVAQILWRHHKQRRVAYLYREVTQQTQAASHPGATGCHRQSAPGSPYLPDLWHREAVLHPALNGRMQRLRPGVEPVTALPRERPFPVNKSLTQNLRRRVVENDEYAAFLRRVIRAYSRRVAAGDIEAIADMAVRGR